MSIRKDTLAFIAVSIAIVLLWGRILYSARETYDSNPLVADATEFELTIASDKPVYQIGKYPQITAILVNNSSQSITLVPAQDGSLCGHYPSMKWDIQAPPGALNDVSRGRCGNTNPLTEDQFFAIAPGESFDVAGDWGGVPPDELNRGPGVYTIQLTYATDESDPQRWLGWSQTSDPSSNLNALLAKVPQMRITSNELTIRVENPFDSPAAMMREGNFDQVMFAFRMIESVDDDLTAAIVDALLRFKPERYTDRKYERLARTALPLLADHCSEEDADRIWSLVGEAVTNRRFSKQFGGYNDGLMPELLAVFLHSHPDSRYKRLAFLFRGHTAMMPGEPPMQPKLRMTPEILQQLENTPGQDIDRLLNSIIDGGTAIDSDMRSAVVRALENRRTPE